MMLGIWLWCAAALAAAGPLDREDVLALARERAPVILAARARAGAAEGHLAAARAWRHNPELELAAGRRRVAGEETWDRSVRIAQGFDLAGRGARIDAAAAGLDAAGHEARQTELAVVASVARSYLRALHAGDARRLADDAAAIQLRLHDVARARHEAGETGALEVHLADVTLARARAALAAARADEAAALADLASHLQLAEPDLPGVAGDLAWPPLPDREVVLAAADAQPALAALAARLRQAEASARLAGAARWPEVGVSGGWEREEDAEIVSLGLNLGLPVFARGQGERRAAAAEARAVVIELEAARRTAADQVSRAWQRQRELQAASDAVAGQAGPALAASVDLAEESYRLGEASLDEVLLVQREQLEAQNELNDLRLAAALAAVDVAEIAALPPLVDEGGTR